MSNPETKDDSNAGNTNQRTSPNNRVHERAVDADEFHGPSFRTRTFWRDDIYIPASNITRRPTNFSLPHDFISAYRPSVTHDSVTREPPVAPSTSHHIERPVEPQLEICQKIEQFDEKLDEVISKIDELNLRMESLEKRNLLRYLMDEIEEFLFKKFTSVDRTTYLQERKNRYEYKNSPSHTSVSDISSNQIPSDINSLENGNSQENKDKSTRKSKSFGSFLKRNREKRESKIGEEYMDSDVKEIFDKIDTVREILSL